MLHSWNLSPKQAIALQKQMATRVILKPLPEEITVVAGADVGYSRGHDRAVAAVATYTYPGLELRELVIFQGKFSYPYVPGLLSFREVPLLLRAFERLREEPDVVLCDGQGTAHPRRFGLASHLGLWLNVPTVGCAKTRLVGTHGKVGPMKGQYRSLQYRDERVGVVLRTRTKVKPLYVSPGHLAEVDGSRKLVERCCTKYRLPEPIRRAHLAAQRAVREGA
ncbi:MAG: deoxyribonuclease V [Deltaproteobacteria bacterium]|jgi:deoxyribonuclease V|nr:deoxyribonuclease V [Deltaproteobacteria bacterium]